MHTLITGAWRVDHADGDGLNNQRSNLRPATTSQNNANRRKRAAPTSSQYKGVSWKKFPGGSGKWYAYIKVASRKRHLGYFASEIAAAEAYNLATAEAFGEFALLNEI